VTICKTHLQRSCVPFWVVRENRLNFGEERVAVTGDGGRLLEECGLSGTWPVLDPVSGPGFSLSLRLRARRVNKVSDASVGPCHNIPSCGQRMSAGTIQAGHLLRSSPTPH